MLKSSISPASVKVKLTFQPYNFPTFQQKIPLKAKTEDHSCEWLPFPDSCITVIMPEHQVLCKLTDRVFCSSFCNVAVSYPQSLFHLRYSVKYRNLSNTSFSFICFRRLSPLWFHVASVTPSFSGLAPFVFCVTQVTSGVL